MYVSWVRVALHSLLATWGRGRNLILVTWGEGQRSSVGLAYCPPNPDFVWTIHAGFKIDVGQVVGLVLGEGFCVGKNGRPLYKGFRTPLVSVQFLPKRLRDCTFPSSEPYGNAMEWLLGCMSFPPAVPRVVNLFTY